MDINEARGIFSAIKENIQKKIVGKDEAIENVLIALACGGHILIEDVPGLGKTTLVSALAKSIDCSFGRIQFTPDVLPSDVTGFTMFDMKTGEKEFHKGAIMSHIVLADEINRTSPKTQSALLEAMQERRVTVDGETHVLPSPFMVLATQNPVELIGTYLLPEAQLDRFLMRISMGYPGRDEEVNILNRSKSGELDGELGVVATDRQIIELQEYIGQVKCIDKLLDYIVELARKTRESEDVSLGVSPRGSIALMRASMARAVLEGRDYVIPDDIQTMAEPVLSHRIVMNAQSSIKEKTAATEIKAVLRAVPVPAVL